MVVIDVQNSIMMDREGNVLADLDDSFMIDLGFPTSMLPICENSHDESFDFEGCMKESLKSLQLSSTILDPIEDIKEFERKIAMIYDNPDENPDLASISQEIELGKRRRSLPEPLPEENVVKSKYYKSECHNHEPADTPSETKFLSSSSSPNSYVVHSRRGFSTQTIEITLEMLEERFHLSLEAAASEIVSVIDL